MSDPNLQHLDDETAERYARGRLADPELARVEEHLLVCAPCRGRVLKADEYIRVVKEAARALPAAPPVVSVRRWQVPAMGIAAAGLLAVFLVRPGPPLPEQQEAALHAMRGGFGGGVKVARARVLLLHLDLRTLAQSPESCAVEVADAQGHPVWHREPLPATGELRVEGPLDSGQYWVRIKARRSGELLREFSLTVA